MENVQLYLFDVIFFLFTVVILYVRHQRSFQKFARQRRRRLRLAKDGVSSFFTASFQPLFRYSSSHLWYGMCPQVGQGREGGNDVVHVTTFIRTQNLIFDSIKRRQLVSNRCSLFISRCKYLNCGNFYNISICFIGVFHRVYIFLSYQPYRCGLYVFCDAFRAIYIPYSKSANFDGRPTHISFH